MNVRDILEAKGRNVITLKPEATLEEAMQVLAGRRIGAIVLTDDADGVAGIVSERDVVRVLGTIGVSALSESIGQMMTANVRTCTEDTTVNEAMEMMTTGRFRHLPVCQNGRLIGIISIGDVVKQRIEEVEREALQMREYIAAG
ncbi:CBS domain-containing protein [Aurantimonas sp. A2-1-M11]|uniref:CBS domain-containing protein n=1 Tax=Aurantimonas sp. A2-1-M11 TaxID=3113712 RepID=UPI002F93BD64